MTNEEKINKNINKVYNDLYKTYIIKLRLNALYNMLFDNVNKINYLENLTNYNTNKIKKLSSQFDINNISYTKEEKKKNREARISKYLSYIEIKKRINEFEIPKIYKSENINKINLINIYMQIIVPFAIGILLFKEIVL